MDIIRACHGPCDWAGPGWAYLKIVTGRAWPGRDFWKNDGPGRTGPSKFENEWAGSGRGPSSRNLMAHPLEIWWAGLGRGPWDVGSVWAAPPGPWGGPCVWRAGLDRCPWDVVYYSYNYDFLGCVWVVIHQKQLRSYYALLANRLGYNTILRV